MSVVLNVEIVNADKLVSALEMSFPEALQAEVSEGMQRVGAEMERDAQIRAPKRTGYMASQIRFEMLSYSNWSFRLVGRAPYTIFQEYGTSRIMPHLFITSSLQLHVDEMLQAVQEAIARAISEAFY
jgi:hypothetical protein